MASPLAVGKLTIRVRNKANSTVHVRVCDARERDVVEQDVERVVEKEEKMMLGGGVKAEFGGVEIGVEAKRGKDTREKTEEKAFVRIQYGKLKESRDWTTIDPGREAFLSSFESPYFSVFIEDSPYQMLNQLIHPEDHPNGIVITRANPPYVSFLTDIIEAANIEAKEAPFRLNNVATKLVLTSAKSMALGASVGVEKKRSRETHEEADPSQLWIRKIDPLCRAGTFRLVPVAFDTKTLAVSPLMDNKLVVAPLTVETDPQDNQKEAKFQQWIMVPAETQDIVQPTMGLCGVLCCQPSKGQLLVSPDMQFEQGPEQRRGSSQFDEHTVTIKCVGLPDYVMSVKTLGRSNSLALTKKDDKGIPMEALWRCSQPNKAKKDVLKVAAVAAATEAEEVNLFEACAEGNKDAVLRVIKAKGVKCLQESDKEGFTPLHYAAQNGHADICRVIVLEGGKDLIKKQTKVMNEPIVLHLAVAKGHVGVVTALLQLGGHGVLTLRNKVNE